MSKVRYNLNSDAIYIIVNNVSNIIICMDYLRAKYIYRNIDQLEILRMKSNYKVKDMGDSVYKFALVNCGELIARRKDNDKPNKHALEKSGKIIAERKIKSNTYTGY